MLIAPPLSLYIHLPWCVRKCPYCDFNSHRQPATADFSGYVDALLADFRSALPEVEGRQLESIFIGGGTPSLFPAKQIERLINGVKALIACSNAMEVTLEANPGTLESGRYAAYRDAGANRLSIGVQSFSANALQRLGRIHGPDEALLAFNQARDAGFININLDLMFGLPEQSIRDAQFDVETAIRLAPEHISYYQLTIEPNTGFAATPPALPSEEHIWDIQLQGQELLERAGYQQYEISAYSSIQNRCRHNLNYWQFGDYLGVGAGAHSKLTHPLQKTVTRSARVRSPALYIGTAGTKSAIAGTHHLQEADLIIEFMMNLLRLKSGFSEQFFMERTGLPLSSLSSMLNKAQQLGLVIEEKHTYRASETGHRYLNDLLELFL